jgi:succinate dehydrogenase / fumarate reductase cytochrome b subunit
MNRLTGILFFFGIVFFSFWIFSAYIGGTTFAWTAWLLSSPFGLFAQFAFLWILSYHSLQGLQHLLWDAGFLFNLSLPQHSIRSLIIAAASILLALFLFFLTR